MLELITPEAKTRTKAKPARAENRRSVGSVISGRAAGLRAGRGGSQDAGKQGQHDDAADPGRHAHQVQAERVDGAFVVGGAGGVSDQRGGDESDEGEHQGRRQASPGRGRRKSAVVTTAAMIDDGQPCAAGLDVGHEVDQGAGEFRVPGDPLPGDVRVAQHQHGNR